MASDSQLFLIYPLAPSPPNPCVCVPMLLSIKYRLCALVCEGVYACTYVWRPEVSIRCLPLWVPTLFFIFWHSFSLAGWPSSTQDLPAPAFHHWNYRNMSPNSTFYVSARGLSSANTLLIDSVTFSHLSPSGGKITHKQKHKENGPTTALKFSVSTAVAELWRP